mmetsp:Transcript_10834/g.13654  ORF Transcript_10834/g.13654 Transcript_10834/m.13654 type:complete len:86 (-) Transcript_10834:2839-3096(-)
MLMMLRSQTFRGPVILYLSDALEMQARAQINMPSGQSGQVLAASFKDRESVDVVTRQSDLDTAFKVMHLTLLDQQELCLGEMAAA